jgi:raffinose/stachyose/melibiose transport system substrate-binding protein
MYRQFSTSTIRALGVAVFLLLATGAAFAGGEQEDNGDGPVELEMTTFWVGTNPLRPWGEILIEEFTNQYEGVYALDVIEVPGDAAHQDRVMARAAAGDVPDITTGNVGLMQNLRDTGLMLELTQYLDADPEWRDSFHPNAFDYYYTDDGELYALPYSRDNVGIYYNTRLFEEAGVEEFPTTWDEFFEASEQLKQSGVIPFAMSRDWINGLMMANMIGTQPGGEEWLTTMDYQMRWIGTEPAITGAELLRDYVQSGYTQQGTTAAPYAEAATLFLQGEAAMIANGPWMINNIKGIGAETIEGLYDNAEYEVSPGNGIISIFGEAAFASGASTEETAEGAVAFLKLATSREQMINQMLLVTRGGTVPVELTEEEAEQIDPLLVSINEKAAQAEHTFPHLNLAFPQAMWDEFINFWPAHIEGAITTGEFLTALDDRIDSYLRQ